MVAAVEPVAKVGLAAPSAVALAVAYAAISFANGAMLSTVDLAVSPTVPMCLTNAQTALAVAVLSAVQLAVVTAVASALAYAVISFANGAVLSAVNLTAIAAVPCALADAGAARIRAHAQTVRPAVELALGTAVTSGLAHTDAAIAVAVSAAVPRNLAALAGKTALADALVAASDLAVFSTIDLAALAPVSRVLADARTGLA